MTTNQKVAGSSPAERAPKSPANEGLLDALVASAHPIAHKASLLGNLTTRRGPLQRKESDVVLLLPALSGEGVKLLK
jgi:hypothetical protein